MRASPSASLRSVFSSAANTSGNSAARGHPPHL